MRIFCLILFVFSVLAIGTLLVMELSSAEKPAEPKTIPWKHGNPQRIELVEGGKVIRTWKSEGAMEYRVDGKRIKFVAAGTGNQVIVLNGTVILTEIKPGE